jgi:hypothetical protein
MLKQMQEEHRGPTVLRGRVDGCQGKVLCVVQEKLLNSDLSAQSIL